MTCRTAAGPRAIIPGMSATTATRRAREPLSTFARANGIGAVIHQTKLDNVAAVLQQGGLLAKKPAAFKTTGVGGDQHQGTVFASLVSDAYETVPLSQATRIKPGDEWQKPWALLVFDLSVLDQKKVHVSSRWLYGEFEPTLSAQGSDRAKLTEVFGQLRGKPPNEAVRNEVVFHRDLQAADLTEISVATPAHRKQLLQDLKESNVTEVNGVNVTKLVRVRKTLRF